MTRKSLIKANLIDPVQICTLALKQIKCAADYHRIGSVNSTEIVTAAWEQLTTDDQQRITDLINSNVQPDPQTVADELVACGNKIDLQTIKSQHGEAIVKAAWKLLPQSERDRIKAICDGEPQPTPETQPEPVIETPEAYPVEQSLQPEPQTKKPTLIELSAELEQLDSLLETIDGDIPVELQTAVDELLAQRNATHEQLLEKLDNYAALIQHRAYWAATRKAEAERLAKLAESDIKTVDFLKSRLKAHLEATEQQKLRTRRFNISVCSNGGKAPLRFDSTPSEQLPERFKLIIVEPDKEAIRTAIEAGEELSFAYLAQRENHLKIK